MKVYVWGTGCGAGELIDRGLDPARITAFLDGEGRGGCFLGRPVLPPEEAERRRAAEGECRRQGVEPGMEVPVWEF